MRSKKTLFLLSALLILLAGAASAAPAADTLTVPESIITRHVPPIPQSGNDALLPYENIRTAPFTDWHPKERRLLVRTRFGESVQLHEVRMPMGARSQVTFHDSPVLSGTYRPGTRNQVVYALDEGGAENYQLFLLDLDSGKARRFTDGKSRNLGSLWSHDGKAVAYVNNSRNGRDFDLYVADPSVPGSERRIAELQGSWGPLDWSPDDRRILLMQYISSTESHLHWVDVASGEVHRLSPPPAAGADTVSYRGGQWARDGRSVFTATDLDSEFLRLVRLPVTEGGPGKPEVLSGDRGDIPWDVEELDLSDDGNLLAFLVNEGGISKLHLLDLRTGRELPTPELPAGTADNLTFRPGSHELALTISWARSPADTYSYDPGTGRMERWTSSEVGGLNPESFVLPELVHFKSFDGRSIPAYVYRPPADRFPGPRPVYISIHGGPEGQFRPGFQGSWNYLVDELGITFIAPNVRGSSGYGKSYIKLDNAEKREDSVKDIGALLDWVAAQPGLDSSRVMVGGGSYGGYMVLASLVHYGDRLCCAYESVGISNFVTFLENTSEYRRDLRRVEYGDERDPEMRAILEKISPLNRVEKIRRPLLVVQGANDPRVPLSESDQIVAALEGGDVPVWYVVAKDEGHGFRKKSNSDYQRAVLVRFIEEFLLGEKKGGAETTGSR